MCKYCETDTCIYLHTFPFAFPFDTLLLEFYVLYSIFPSNVEFNHFARVHNFLMVYNGKIMAQHTNTCTKALMTL